MSLKGTQLQLFPNMLPYKVLPLFRNTLNYTICRIYTADIVAILYTPTPCFFVGFLNVFQALSRARWLGAFFQKPVGGCLTGILHNKGGHLSDEGTMICLMSSGIYIYIICIYIESTYISRHVHMMLAFQIFTQIIYLSMLGFYPDVHVILKIYSAPGGLEEKDCLMKGWEAWPGE